MMYARIENGIIVEVNTPTHLPIFYDDRWWDCRDPAERQDYIVAANWVPVVETPRPADTATDTSVLTHELVEGLPTQVWVVRPWTAEELTAQQEAATAAAQAEADRAILDAIAYTSETAHTEGEAWVAPTGAHDAYPKDAAVTHAGKDWESLTAANVWEPGVSGWREVVGEGYPAWVQPTGAHDDYDVGAIVSHNGSDWISTAASNVWEPGVYGWSTYTP